MVYRKIMNIILFQYAVSVVHDVLLYSWKIDFSISIASFSLSLCLYVASLSSIITLRPGDSEGSTAKPNSLLKIRSSEYEIISNL